MKYAFDSRVAHALLAAHARITRFDFLAHLRGKWTHALFLVPVVAIPLAMIELGDAVNSTSSFAAVASALRHPLSLLTDGSPGGRAPGALLSTKPNYGPHERVLSQTRERETPAAPSTVPPAELPSGASPETATGPEDQSGIAPPGNAPFANGSPLSNDITPGGMFGYPGFSGFGLPNSAGALGPILDVANVLSPSGTITVPESQTSGSDSAVTSLVTTPQDQGTTPDNQPVFPPSDTNSPVENGIIPPDQIPVSPPANILPVLTTPAIAVPEPSTWSLMLFGLLFIAATARRRVQKQASAQ